LTWQLQKNPAGNLAGAIPGWICSKWPDAGPAGAGAEIWYIPALK